MIKYSLNKSKFEYIKMALNIINLHQDVLFASFKKLSESDILSLAFVCKRFSELEVVSDAIAERQKAICDTMATLKTSIDDLFYEKRFNNIQIRPNHVTMYFECSSLAECKYYVQLYRSFNKNISCEGVQTQLIIAGEGKKKALWSKTVKYKWQFELNRSTSHHPEMIIEMVGRVQKKIHASPMGVSEMHCIEQGVAVKYKLKNVNFRLLLQMAKN